MQITVARNIGSRNFNSLAPSNMVNNIDLAVCYGIAIHVHCRYMYMHMVEIGKAYHH